MPEISRFLGISIRIFYRDRSPPHFHAVYGEYEVVVFLATGAVEGTFPKRALRHVLEWFEAHEQELLEDWHRASRREPLAPIPPLE